MSEKAKQAQVPQVPEKVENQQKNEDQQFMGKMEECGERSQYHNLVDILFVIDATGSMSWCISQMKKTVCKIMKKFADKQYNIKFAIELYRDHPPQQYSYVEKHFDLRNMDAIIKVIDDECDVAGGGDTPEAVFDGLVHGLKKTSWRVSSDGKTKSKRFLYHGCDAPPHGKQYGSISTDKKWQKDGCPCGFTRHDVKKLLDEFSVDYSLIKCGIEADIMAGLFKECFGEKFKRQLQIKNDNKRGGRGRGGRERKTSACYMDQIQRQEKEGSALQDSQQSYEEQPIQRCIQRCEDISEMKCVDELDIKEVKKQQSILSKLKSFFGSDKKQKQSKVVKKSSPEMLQKMEAPKKKKKNKKAPVVKQAKMVQKKQKKQDYSDNSSGQEGEGKPRSMASLVLSDLQDGIDKHFEEEEKKQKKVTRDI